MNNLDELSDILIPFRDFINDIIYFSLEQYENKSGEYWIVYFILSDIKGLKT
jgi:hypothetical protein